MTYPTRRPVEQRFAAPATDDVDRLLTRFFRAALPEPWPSCPRPEADETTTILPPKRFAFGPFLRLPGRLTAAAAVAGLVIGYLALQTWIPDPKPSGPMVMEVGPAMGFLPPKTGNYLDHTRSDRPARLEIQETPKPKTFIMLIEELPAKK